MEAAPPNPTDATKPTGMLVVDDHDLVRLGLRTLVQSHAAANGHEVQVFEARTLQEALALYRDQQAAIGMVLLELHLPDAHGLSGLVTFIAQFPAARVVVLSGVSDPALVREAMARGASAFLAKSGDLQHVVCYIRSLGLLGQSGALPTSEPVGNALADDDSESAGLRIVRTMRTSAGDRLQLTARQARCSKKICRAALSTPTPHASCVLCTRWALRSTPCSMSRAWTPVSSCPSYRRRH